MNMFRTLTLVAVVLLTTGPVAAAQTPFVANHLVSDAVWASPVGPFDYMDLPGSEQVLDIPAGTALITWSCSMFGDLQTRIRPKIGADFPLDGTVVSGGRSTGSWLVTTSGGSVTVNLQVKNLLDGQPTGQVSGASSMSWSLVVMPSGAENVPALGTAASAVMVLLILSAGAAIIARRKQPIA